MCMAIRLPRDAEGLGRAEACAHAVAKPTGMRAARGIQSCSDRPVIAAGTARVAAWDPTAPKATTRSPTRASLDAGSDLAHGFGNRIADDGRRRARAGEQICFLDADRSYVGKELGVSDWFEVTQETINRFAELTRDDQWIHLDVERAKQTPFGGRVAHGYYVLSRAPRFSYDMFTLKRLGFSLSYGLNRARFPAPIPVGDGCKCAPNSRRWRSSQAGCR